MIARGASESPGPSSATHGAASSIMAQTRRRVHAQPCSSAGSNIYARFVPVAYADDDDLARYCRKRELAFSKTNVGYAHAGEVRNRGTRDAPAVYRKG